MKKKNKTYKPIYYMDQTDLDKPVHALIEQLRLDLAKLRGKIFDIKNTYGCEDMFEFLEGGLTCMIAAMSLTQEEIKKHEIKHKV